MKTTKRMTVARIKNITANGQTIKAVVATYIDAQGYDDFYVFSLNELVNKGIEI